MTISIRDWIRNNLLYFYSLLLIVLTPIDYLLYLSWINSMRNYIWFSSSIIFPLFSIFFFSMGTLWFVLKKQTIDKVPQIELIKIGILDGLSSQISSFSIPFLSMISVTILDKLALPVTMIGSKIYLNKLYYKNHYLSVFLTIYAILITFIPSFKDDKNNYWWAVILYTSAIFPSVMSYILKEKQLINPVNIWWMNTWVSIWQFLFGIILLPIMFIPVGKQGLNYIPPDDFVNYMNDGIKCQFVGIGTKKDDYCNYSLILMISYQIISTLINIIMFEIIKNGSSTYFILINCLKIPIQFWLGSIKIISGNNYAPVNINNFFTAILLMVSVLIYNDKKEGSLENKISVNLSQNTIIREYHNLNGDINDDENDHHVLIL